MAWLIWVTERERDELYAARRSALLAAPNVRLSANGRLAVAPVGVGGYLRIARRDTDGSIVAAVRVLAGGSNGPAGYVRRVRITTHEKPSSRRIRFRLARDHD